MKRVTILAFLAAFGLLATGCGDGESTGSSLLGGNSNPLAPDSSGFTHSTQLVDENNNTFDNITKIKSDATGETPPAAPTFVKYATGVVASVPAPPVAGAALPVASK